MPENDFLWPVFSPYFLILVSVFEWADKSCLWPIFALVTCDQYRTCKHDMLYAFKPCALEINSNGGFKRDHVEPCFSTTLYLHYHIAYVHQTWQDGDLPWGVLSYRVNWSLGYVVLRVQATQWNHNISTIYNNQTWQGGGFLWRATTSKVTWPFDQVSNVKSWSNLKNLYLQFHKNYGY